MESQTVNWVQKKYNQNQEFKNHMDQVQKSYKDAYQISIYSNLQSIEKKQIIKKVGTDLSSNPLYCIYGMFFPIQQLQIQKVFLYMINIMDQQINKIEKKYSFIYFNTLCSGYQNFVNFKNMLKSLPLKYFTKLDKIIVVHPNLALRSLQLISFGTLNNFIAKCLIFLDRLQEINSHNINTLELSTKLPKQIINVDNTYNNVPELKSQKSIKPVLQYKNISTKQVQGISGNNINTKKFSDYQMTQFGVPIMLKMLFNYFELKPNKIKYEGVFRKNGDIEQIRILQKNMQIKNYQYIYHVQNPFVICDYIKKIFTQLEQPIFPFNFYQKIINNINNIQLSFVKQTVLQLPKLNYATLQFTINQLIQKVTTNQSQNKMSNYNLSVCFSPCFFRPRQYKMQDLLKSGIFVKFLKIIFDNFTLIFGSKKQQQQLFRNSSDKTSLERSKNVYTLIRKNSRPVQNIMDNNNKQLVKINNIFQNNFLNIQKTTSEIVKKNRRQIGSTMNIRSQYDNQNKKMQSRLTVKPPENLQSRSNQKNKNTINQSIPPVVIRLTHQGTSITQKPK